jgi:hypothetical protein
MIIDNIEIQGESEHFKSITDDIETMCEEQIKPEFEWRDIVKIEIRPI